MTLAHQIEALVQGLVDQQALPDTWWTPKLAAVLAAVARLERGDVATRSRTAARLATLSTECGRLRGETLALYGRVRDAEARARAAETRLACLVAERAEAHDAEVARWHED